MRCIFAAGQHDLPQVIGNFPLSFAELEREKSVLFVKKYTMVCTATFWSSSKIMEYKILLLPLQIRNYFLSNSPS